MSTVAKPASLIGSAQAILRRNPSSTAAGLCLPYPCSGFAIRGYLPGLNVRPIAMTCGLHTVRSVFVSGQCWPRCEQGHPVPEFWPPKLPGFPKIFYFCVIGLERDDWMS